jgi:aminotransferase EvaB
MLINDLSLKIANYRHSIDAAVSRVLNRSWLILGPEVGLFERSFAEYVGVNHCITVANGTDAIELGLRAIGVQQGDVVATVANAGFYTSTALLAVGAIPFYLDVDLETRVVSLNEIERAISKGIKVVVVTHLYGQAAPNIAKIAELCRVTGVMLIEDCAQAHGAKVDGKQVGSFGEIGCFSFYPTKNLGALGDGGAVVCNEVSLDVKVRQLRQYGWSSKYQVDLAGACNSRLDEMQAAILTEFLPHLDSWNARRREIATTYSTQIKNSNVILPKVGSVDYVAHLYVVRSAQRNELQLHLRDADIASDIHYPTPDYRQTVYGDQFASVTLPNTEILAKEILTLPCYPEMTDGDINRVVTAVNGWQA